MFMPVVQVRPMGVTVFQRLMCVFVIVGVWFGCTVRVGMFMMRVGMAVQVGVDEGLVPVVMLMGFPEQQVD